MSRSTYLATAAMVWALCPAMLHAQAFNDADAHYKVMAPNQVEAKRGVLDYAETDLSVGSGAFPDRLDFQRLSAPSTSIAQSSGIIPEMGWLRHNFEVVIACDHGSGSNKDVNCPTELVTIGNTNYRFNLVNGAWQSIYNDGNRLDQSADQFVFTSRDGDRIVFPRSPNFYQYAGTAHLASTWIFPDGNHLDFTYELARSGNGGWNDWHRLVSVENAEGFGYRFSYLEPGGGKYNEENWTNDDFRKITIASVQIIAPGCGSNCPSVHYGYQVWGGTIPAMKLATATDALGAVSSFTWTDTRNLVSETQKGSSALKFSATYDAKGGVTQLVDAAGQNWGYERKLNNAGTDVYMTVVTDPKGGKTSYYFPYAGTITPQTITDPLGHVTTYGYDPASGRLTKVAFPEGNSIEYGYDARGNLTRVTQHAKANSGTADIAKMAVYPADCTNVLVCNKPTSTSDWANNVTDYQYDAGTGLLTARTDPAVNGGVRPQQRTAYAQVQAAWSGTVWRLATLSECRTGASCSGTADETRTSWSYGNNLLATAMTVAAGDHSVAATTATTYDALGNPASRTDPLGRVTTMTWDAARQLTGMTGPDPDGTGPLKNRAMRIHYLASGQPDTITLGTAAADGSSFQALQVEARAYDGANRLIRRRRSDGQTDYAVTDYGYDGLGALQCEAVRMNPAGFGSLPGSACTQGTAGSFGPDRITAYSYDGAGQLTRLTSGYGVTGLQRDELSYAYNPNGTVATLGDAKGNVTTYYYDGLDRLSKTVFPSPSAAGQGNPNDYEQLSLDADGNVTARRLRDGRTIGYGYDALGRRTSMTFPATGITQDANMSYGYDLQGRLLQAQDANTHRAVYSYDALGRTVSEGDPWGTFSSQYDAAGRRTRLTWRDGFFVTYDYDNADEMTAIHENGGGVLASFGYDDLGRRTSRGLANGTSTSYGYDAMSRLTTLSLNGGANPTVITLGGYNPAGEIDSRSNGNDAYAWAQAVNVNRAYATNGLNQITQSGNVALGYDARGNLTTSGSSTYGYDSKNELITANGFSAYYDPLGRLDQLSDDQVQFEYDGAQLTTELNSASNTILRRYVFGPGVDEPIVWYEGSGTTDKRYLDQDERGSITRITDGTGKTLAIDSYDEFGIPASGNLGRFQYTGQAWLPSLGMYSFKARIYSPTLGRFMQTDPIGYVGGVNWYNYARGNPINNADPTGLVDDPMYGLPPIYGYGGCMYQCTPGSTPSGPIGSTTTGAFGYGWNPTNGPGIRVPPLLSARKSTTQPTVTPQKQMTFKSVGCDQAESESGTVDITSTTGSFIAGTGAFAAFGTFRNRATGTRGFYWSLGGGFGADLGISTMAGAVRSLAGFAGNGQTANIGVGGGASVIYDVNGHYLGYIKGIANRGASYTRGKTTLFHCEASK